MDQAIGGRPAKQEVLDKRRSLQNPSGNLLDIYVDGPGRGKWRADRLGTGRHAPLRLAATPGQSVDRAIAGDGADERIQSRPKPLGNSTA